MDILLYNNHSEKNELNKFIDGEAVFQGTMRQETSVSDPEFLIEFNGYLSSFNYCYIPDFQRYYYILDVSVVRTSLWRVSCHVDVLMSFKDEILSSYAILDESTVTGISNYLANDVWRELAKDTTTIIKFSHGLKSSGEYILITAGG